MVAASNSGGKPRFSMGLLQVFYGFLLDGTWCLCLRTRHSRELSSESRVRMWVHTWDLDHSKCHPAQLGPSPPHRKPSWKSKPGGGKFPPRRLLGPSFWTRNWLPQHVQSHVRIIWQPTPSQDVYEVRFGNPVGGEEQHQLHQARWDLPSISTLGQPCYQLLFHWPMVHHQMPTETIPNIESFWLAETFEIIKSNH